MRKIYLVRHGETVANSCQRLQGQSDTKLNATGLAQAKQVGEFFKAIPLQAVYCSPLSRALITAQAVAGGHKLPVHPLEELKEIALGEWVGFNREELNARWANAWEDFFERPATVVVPGGENVFDVQRRADKALKLILAEVLEGDIAIVTHAGPIRALLCGLFKIDFNQFWHLRIRNASTTCLAIEKGQFYLEYTNLHYYLQESLKTDV
jgi:broad specificity phosphatase PhoE